MNSRRAGVIAILFIAGMFLLWILSSSSPEAHRLTGGLMGFDGLVLTHTAEGSRHMYKGQTTLDAPCDALGISTTLDATTRTAQVVMQTQRLPGATCEPKKSPYSFAFAVISDTNPAAVIVTLDGRTLPSKVIEQ